MQGTTPKKSHVLHRPSTFPGPGSLKHSVGPWGQDLGSWPQTRTHICSWRGDADTKPPGRCTHPLLPVRLGSVLSWRTHHQGCPCPNPHNLWTWYTHGKRDFVCVINLRTSRYRDYPELFRCVNVITRVCKRELAGSESEKEMWRQKQRLEGCSPEPRNASSL